MAAIAAPKAEMTKSDLAESGVDRAGGAGAGPLPPHVVAIPGGTWNAWRRVGVRGAGFAATKVLRMSAPESAAAIDQALSESPGGKVDTSVIERTTWAKELDRIYAAAAELAKDPAFREALVWQNRSVIHQTLEPFLRDEGGRGWKARQRLAVIARYLQRYCTKNETIGFFGPVGWAHISDSGPPVAVTCGPALVGERNVDFEHWALRELTTALAARFDFRPWARPRLLPFFFIDGDRLLVPGRPPVPLQPEQAQLLRACDGTLRARELAALAIARGAPGLQTEADAFALLDQLVQFGVISWNINLPVCEGPEVLLRAELGDVDDATIREPAVAALDQLIGAKDAVVAAAGDPVALDHAMAGLEAAFTSATGASPTRHAGMMWAARTIVYEDTVRDAEVTFGPALLERIGPALSLFLDGFRWFTWRIAERYSSILAAMYDEMAAARQNPAQLELTELYRPFSLKYMGEDGADPVARRQADIGDIVSDFHKRWFDLFAHDPTARVVRLRSADISARVAAAFVAPSMGWPGAYLTPNLSIAARGPEAFARGEFTVVLGKTHPGNTLLKAAFVDQHPDRAALERELFADHPTAQVEPISGPLVSRRLRFSLRSPSTYWLHYSADAPGCEPDRLLRIADLVAYRAEAGVRVKTRDGRLDFDLIQFLAAWLADVCHSSSNLLPKDEHRPRLMVDDLVVERERWTFAATALPFARQKETLAIFAEARRWALSHGLPRYLFARIDGEPKPIFVDTESPVYIDMLARLIRAGLERNPAARVSVTEMLPAFDELWLRDGAGQLYTSELLLVTLERRV